MANALANFGLGLQGMDAGRQADQALEAQRQSIEAQKRANLLRDQQIQVGNMGLEDVNRQRSNLAAERAAVSGATDMDSTYSAVAGARRAAGNLPGVEDVTAKQRANVTNALMRLAQQAQMGADPKLAEAELKQSGIGKDIAPGTLTWGFDPSTKEHLIMYVDTNGRNQAQSATAIIRANSKQDVKTIPAGGSALITQPGTAPQMLTAPQKLPDHALNSNFVTRKNEDGSETLIDLRNKQPVAGGESGGPNVRKDLPVLNDITKGITELGEEYGKTDMSNPLNPKITLTPKGQQTALIAEQIRMANPKLAPRTIIDMATKGKPMWKVENGNRTGVVLYNGQEFPMNTPRAAPVSTAPAPTAPATTAKPAAVNPATPAPAAQPAPVLERPIVDTEQRDREIERMKVVTGGGEADKRRELVRKNKAELDKQFSSRVSRLSKEDRMWLEDRVSIMTNAQKRAYRQAKEKTRFKSGGKVEHHHGLG